MSVFKNSRYEGVEFTGIRGEDGVVRKFLHQREPLTPETVREGFVVHPLEKSEELDELAWKQGSKKPLNWWVIADVNNVLFPMTATLDDTRGEHTPKELEPGAEILMPIVELQERKEP